MLLDRESIASIFVNRALMNNFQAVNNPLVSITNGSIARPGTIAYLKRYGDVYGTMQNQ